jgi:hypothetical protein
LPANAVCGIKNGHPDRGGATHFPLFRSCEAVGLRSGGILVRFFWKYPTQNWPIFFLDPSSKSTSQLVADISQLFSTLSALNVSLHAIIE